jgi:tetratricopeptide (TPR) repeat protein
MINSSQHSVIQEYARKINQYPDSHKFYLDLAEKLMGIGESQKAFRACLKGIEYAGYCPEIIHHWATQMSQVGLWQEAKELFRLALCQDSGNAQLYHSLGSVLGHLGEAVEAQATMEIGRSILKANASMLSTAQLESCVTLADSLRRQSRFDEARRVCQAALRVSPNSQQINNILQSLP